MNMNRHHQTEGEPDAPASFPPAVTVPPRRRAVNHSLAVPGSKSQANRAILLAGVGEGRSVLRGLPDSDDIEAALSALTGLGIGWRRMGPDSLEIAGQGLAFPRREGDLAIRSSGTVGRFLPGLLAASPAGRWRLVSTDQLARRPLGPLVEALRGWGGRAAPETPGLSFPLVVRGGGLAGGEIELSAALSSQFASGMLMAAPLAGRTARVVIRDLDPEETYIDLTLGLMRRFGVESRSERLADGALAIEVAAPQTYRATDIRIDADANSAAYFLSLPLLLGGRVRVTNLPAVPGRDVQPGEKFLAVLARLGAGVERDGEGTTVRSDGPPLRGGFSLDMRAMAELAPTLAVLAAFADAPIGMTNLAHIRGHETDRLAALARLLGEVGAPAECGDSWLRVGPVLPGSLRPATIDSLGDHRLAMAFSLFGMAGAGVTITHPEAVSKTFPDFFARLALVE